MAVSDVLLGTAPKVSTQRLPTMSPRQQAVYAELLKSLNQGNGADPYTGQLGSPLSSLETTSLAGLEQAAMDAVSGSSGALYDQGNSVLSDILSRGPEDIDDYFTKTVQDPLLESFREDISPAISRRFAPSGFYSSERLGADQRANEELVDTLGRERSRISYESLQDNTANKLAGLGLLPGIAGAKSNELMALLAAGKQPRDAALMNNQLNYEEFRRQQDQKDTRTKALMAALGIPEFENVVTVKPGSQGLAAGVAQGAGAFLGGYFG